ncbi:hypothetical protein VTO42DRAFT_5569 [Malbranchea cinnamomea]
MWRSKAQAQQQSAAEDCQTRSVVPDGTGEEGQQSAFSLQGIRALALAVLVLVLAGVSSTVSQLALSPVYGSVPSGIYHRRGFMLAALSGWIGKNRLNTIFFSRLKYFLPVLAFSIPTIQYFLFQQSNKLGPVRGPLVTELLTYYPLAALSSYVAAFLLEGVSLGQCSRTIKDHGVFLGSYLLLSTVQKWTTAAIPRYIGSSIIYTRVGLQLMIAILYAVSLPSKYLLLAVPSLLFTVGYNPHTPLAHSTALLNSALQQENYILLDRRESLTGYLSVLENEKSQFRVLRCDHSLLGGEWTWTPRGPKPKVAEPIYAVFTMLEAIRLVESDDGSASKPDIDKNALVIGLGIGTTPAALITHGIDTTVVEIDPAVYELAIKYFTLPGNFTSELRDAVEYVKDARESRLKFDYIVHDVFTGGVEPVDLFTLEFMQGLHDLLADDGVIAVNYAGDLSLPSAGQVIRTVLSTFTSCRIFRESEQSTNTDEGDFTNTVIFCKKTHGPLKFRKPVKADFLGCRSREAYLLPKYEIDPAVFENSGDESQSVLQAEKSSQLQAWQFKGAVGHWHIMRGVLPPVVWENW